MGVGVTGAAREAPVDRPVVPPLRVGPLEVWPPVVLAPMAGITNAPFRRLCHGFGAAALADAGPGPNPPTAARRDAGAAEPANAHGGLFVSEMITARGLAERNDKTLRMARFAGDEPVRSIQLYGTDPRSMGEAVRFLAGDEAADHVDLNFGCPVAKVTRKGGGAALPVHRALFREVVRAAVHGAGSVPVTVKLRIGVDDRLTTFLDAGRIARDEGAAAVALHARTATQHYSGRADWRAISELRAAVPDVPVLGNGDVWQAADALRMVAETGCDGVVVGRGCLGRPWLFGDLARAFAGRPVPPAPPLQAVTEVLRRHAHLLAAWLTEPVAVRDVRKHVGWYLQGYPVGGEVRRRLTQTSTIAELDEALATLAAEHPDLRVVDGADALPRGKTSGPIAVTLPDGWLASADDPTPVVAEELEAVSGG
ncbi:MAG TPA: tRNA dihydrouridine synthase DusB [Acidimicrobiales bacterium]|nr:tRNA dihydrouridine synthase DusB [Acidimicrobiales bacterium]